MVPILLDTDVCLDSIAGREPWNTAADRIFHSAVEDKTSVYISGLSFSNLFYLLQKVHGARRTVEKLLAMRKLVSVSVINADVVDGAFDSSWKDFEDALQYQSACQAGCEVLVTRNLTDYKNSGDVSVLAPSEFVRQYLE
jgi:predicted nucleic acid-binding protein